MLVKLVCFILGFICGMSFVIVASCMVISSEESRNEENEHKTRKEISTY